MKPTKEQIKQYYSQALQRCLDSYARLDDKEWGKKASDRWTAKEFLAHLVTSQEDVGNRITRQAVAGQPLEIPGHRGRDGINEHNEEALTKARDLSVPELLSRLKTAVEEHLSMLESLSEADLDK